MRRHIRRHQFLALLLTAAVLLSVLPVPALAAEGYIDSISDASWTPVYQKGSLNEPLGDKQTGGTSASQDIVGDENYSSVFYHFSAERLSFRIRVNSVDGGTSAADYQFKNFAYIGMDTDFDGRIDLFGGAYCPHSSTGRIAIYPAGDGANTSPATTTIGKAVLALQPKRGENFSIIEAKDSNFSGNADYFVSFSIPVSDINDALGTETFDENTPFRFYVGTSSQDNSLKQDINGIEGGLTSSVPWTKLGVFSDIATPSGGLNSTGFITVTFDENSGDQTPDPNVIKRTSGTTVGVTPTVTKKGGYVFSGWNTQADGKGTTVNASTVVTGDMTVYAQWVKTEQSFEITYICNGGYFSGNSTQKTMSVAEGTPDVPTKTDSIFSGWYTEQEGGTLFDVTAEITKKMTVYAHWSASHGNQYTAIYKSNDGGIIYSTFSWNGNDNKSTHPTLPDHTREAFAGWTETPGGSDVVGKGGDVANYGAKDHIYYAVFTPKTFTNVNIPFDANAGSDTVTGMPQQRVATPDGLFGSPIPDAPSREGYTFLEWNLAADGTGEKVFPTTEIITDTTVYAIWQVIEKATFDANIADESLEIAEYKTQSINLTAGKLNYYPVPPVLKDTVKKTFMGWMTAANGTAVDVNIYGTLTSGATYYALWEDIYQVTFYTNGGKFPDNTTSLIVDTAYGSVLYTPGDPTYAGATFKGWNTKPDGTGEDFDVTDSVTENIVVYAQWTPVAENVLVTFDSDGGSLVPGAVIAKNTAVSKPTDPTRENYTFDGWYDGETPWNFSNTISTNKTLKAKWTSTSSTYTVIWKSQDGTSTYETDSNVDYGTAPAYNAAAPTKQADAQYTYTFAGWATSANQESGTAEGSLPTVTGDDTYYAAFSKTLNKYTVTWNTNGGSTLTGSYTSGSVDYGITIVAPENPTKTADAQYSYTFDGWYDAATDGNKITSFGTVTKDVTYYAHYTQTTNTYTVTVNVNEAGYGSVNQSSVTSVPYGTVITTNNNTITVNGTTVAATPTAATAQYTYAFKDWTNGTATVTDNITVTANFTRTTNKYTVTWNSQDGSSTYETDLNVEYGSAPDYNDAAPTKQADAQYTYTFAGWATSAAQESGTAEGSLPTVTGNVTYYAAFSKTAKTYTISYELDGGTNDTGNPATYTYGVGVASFADASKTGHAFDGWYDAATNGNKVTDIPTTATGDKTLYARFTANKYTITYNAGTNGTGTVASQEKTHSQNLALQSDKFTREGYTQTGWATSDGGTKAHDLGGTYTTDASTTLYPVWTVNTHTVTWVTDGDALTGTFTEGTTEYGTVITAPNTPTKTGYTSAGWSPAVPSTMPDSDQTFTATWTQNTYTVTVNVNEAGYGSVSQSSVTSVPHGIVITTNNNTITVNGTTVTATPTTATAQYTYTFADWTNGTATVTDNITVTANFTRTTNKYDITYKGGPTNGVEYGKIITVAPNGGDWTNLGGWLPEGDNYKTELTENLCIPDPTAPSGYTFNGWTKTEDAAGNVTLTAGWTPISYNVILHGNGGTGTSLTSYTYGTGAVLPTDWEKTDAAFLGWYDSPDFVNPAVTLISVTATGDKEFYAKWQLKANYDLFDDIGTPPSGIDSVTLY